MERCLYKSQLVAALANRTGQSKRATDILLSELVDVIAEALEDGVPVQIGGFGTFFLQARDARRARHPRTGQEIIVRARKTPKFRPAPGLRSRVEGSEVVE